LGLGSGVGGGGWWRTGAGLGAVGGCLGNGTPVVAPAALVVHGSGVSGDGETGEGSDGVMDGQGVDALDDLEDGIDASDDATLTGDDVDEQSEPQREPDSRRWFNMCDVSAAAVL